MTDLKLVLNQPGLTPSSGPLVGRLTPYWTRDGVPVLVGPAIYRDHQADPLPGMTCCDMRGNMFAVDSGGELVPLGWSADDARSIKERLEQIAAQLLELAEGTTVDRASS